MSLLFLFLSTDVRATLKIGIQVYFMTDDSFYNQINDGISGDDIDVRGIEGIPDWKRRA